MRLFQAVWILLPWNKTTLTTPRSGSVTSVTQCWAWMLEEVKQLSSHPDSQPVSVRTSVIAHCADVGSSHVTAVRLVFLYHLCVSPIRPPTPALRSAGTPCILLTAAAERVVTDLSWGDSYVIPYATIKTAMLEVFMSQQNNVVNLCMFVCRIICQSKCMVCI